MAFKHKEGRGRVWLNKAKESIDDNRPHFKGNAMAGGVVWDVALWTERDGEGKLEGFSMKLDEPWEREERQQELPIKKPLRPLRDDLDDDIF